MGEEMRSSRHFSNKSVNIGNIVVGENHKTNIRDYLAAFVCPDCDALFTIELPDDGSKWSRYCTYTTNCPVCGKCHNWTVYRISLTEYKFRRAWREFRHKMSTRDKHSI